MSASRPTRTPRLLLALACGLALLAPAAAAARPAGAGRSPSAALAGAPEDLGHALLRDPVAGPLVAPGGKRDDRERPGPALVGGLVAALATAAWAAARRSTRPARRRADGGRAGARAPPFQPAAV